FHPAPARPIGLRYRQRHGMTSLDQSLQGRDSESRSSTENQNHRRAVTIAFTAFVIPSEARNLHFAAECRSLASLGMTIHEEGSLPLSRLHHFLDLALDQVALQCADVRDVQLAVQVIGLMQEGRSEEH